ncbi:MAG: hypothetical protein U9O87_05005 [Verrucomicrobiota bacterium]|nr:hypothetical protein [Verrucomicrobiota bacterium]
MKINGVIEKKLLFLEEELIQIESWPIKDYFSFKGSSLQKSAVERGLTVCVEL